MPEPAELVEIRLRAKDTRCDFSNAGLPSLGGLIVGNGVAESWWAVNLAERIDSGSYTIRTPWSHSCRAQGTNHGGTGNAGVDGQKDVVDNSKVAEEVGLAETKWLVASLAVPTVHELDRANVDDGKSDGQPGVESGIEGTLAEVEGHSGSWGGRVWDNGKGVMAWWKFEERRRWRRQLRKGTGHGEYGY